MNNSRRKFCFLIPFAILGFAALFTYAVYALWNGVLADVTGVKTITYWQALGILVLAKILFGGMPCGRRRGPGGWRDPMMSRHWNSLTPEQREQMRDEIRRRFGEWPQPPWCRSDRGASTGPDSPSKP